jgi:hypothetical protein
MDDYQFWIHVAPSILPTKCLKMDDAAMKVITYVYKIILWIGIAVFGCLYCQNMHIISHLFPFSVQFKDTNLSKPHDSIYLCNCNNMITILDIQRLSFTSEVNYIQNQHKIMMWLKLIGLNLSAQINHSHSQTYISFIQTFLKVTELVHNWNVCSHYIRNILNFFPCSTVSQLQCNINICNTSDIIILILPS